MGTLEPCLDKSEASYKDRSVDEKKENLLLLDLQKDSKEWTPENWEQFLKKIEIPISETLISSNGYNRRKELQTESIFRRVADTPSRGLQKKALKLLQPLTERQRQIIELLYWGHKSEREVAKILGISRSTVRVIQKRSIQRIKQIHFRHSLTTKLLVNSDDINDLKL